MYFQEKRSNEIGYLPFNSLTASVFGFHSGSEYAHPSPDYDLSVYVLKNNTDSQLTQMILKQSGLWQRELLAR